DAIKDDAVLGVILQHEMTEAQGGTPEGTAAAPPPDTETMIQDLVAAGRDEAALRAMSPEELLALWQPTKGAPMADPTPPAAVAVPPVPDAAAAAPALRQFRAAVTAGLRRIHAAERQSAERLAAAERVRSAALLEDMRRRAEDALKRALDRSGIAPWEN